MMSGRRPQCSQCKAHGHNIDLRGHKRLCQFKDCVCENCNFIRERQKIMAKQVALSRQQQQDSSVEKQKLFHSFMDDKSESDTKKSGEEILCSLHQVAKQTVLSTGYFSPWPILYLIWREHAPDQNLVDKIIQSWQEWEQLIASLSVPEPLPQPPLQWCMLGSNSSFPDSNDMTICRY